MVIHRACLYVFDNGPTGLDMITGTLIFPVHQEF